MPHSIYGEPTSRKQQVHGNSGLAKVIGTIKSYEPESVIASTCSYFETTRWVLFRKKTHKRYEKKLLLFLLYTHSFRSHTKLGEFMGYKDHTTALLGYIWVKEKIGLRSLNEELKARINKDLAAIIRLIEID